VGKDHTLYALCEGVVAFERKGKEQRTFVRVDAPCVDACNQAAA
jgi:ribosomal protein L27